jgi:hypothetical protein
MSVFVPPSAAVARAGDMTPKKDATTNNLTNVFRELIGASSFFEDDG